MLQLSNFRKIDYRSDSNIELSLLHLNIRSLNKNNMALYHLLDLLNLEFGVIVLSEVWSYNIDLYHNLLVGYDFHYDLPLSDAIGAVGIFVKTVLGCTILNDLKIISSDQYKVDNLWLAGSKEEYKNIYCRWHI